MPEQNKTILFNFSNLIKGGALQVASSLVNEHLSKTPRENVYFVFSKALYEYLLKGNIPIEKLKYAILHTSVASFSSRTRALRELHLIEKEVTPLAVVTLFGPSYWRPQCKTHIVGYAIPHYLFPESPFFNVIGWKNKIRIFFKKHYQMFYFKRDTDFFMAETQIVKDKLTERFKIPQQRIEVISNTYHQIFEMEKEWIPMHLPAKTQGEIWLLSIGAKYRHKNFEIIPDLISALIKKGFKNFKFIVTLDQETFGAINPAFSKHIIFLGPVNIAQCPAIFKSCDFLFLPTLLECFSASYAEAMISKLPILTSDLPFAKDICRGAAIYFDPMDVKDISDKIIEVSGNKQLQKSLVEKGVVRVKEFDNSKERFNKIIQLVKKLTAQ